MESKPEIVTSTRLTPEERRLTEAGARARNLTVSAFVRRVLVPAVRADLRRTADEDYVSDLPPAA